MHRFLAVLLVAGCATAGDEPPPPGGDGAPDASADAAPDAHFDAAPPDATPPPSAVVSLEPARLVIARGAVGKLIVTLDRPALAGGQLVQISSDDPGGTSFVVPATVTVPEGALTADVPVTSVSYGAAMDVRARLGSTLVASSVQIVPAFVSISPSDADLTLGTTVNFVITMEAAITTDYTLFLTTSDASIARLGVTSVTILAGRSSTSFPVTGAALGTADVKAGLGGGEIAAKARVVGLFLSEIMYNPSTTDTMWEWVELYNPTAQNLDVAGLSIQTNTGTGYRPSLVLAGTINAGQCVVVGGPLKGPENALPVTFTFFVAGDIEPDLGNVAGGVADGIALANGTGQRVDAVIYGTVNSDGIVDETGTVPGAPDVGAVASPAHTLERTSPGRTGLWGNQPVPTPGDCTAMAL